MKKLCKRFLSLLAASAMILSLFTGCSGQKALRVGITEINKHGNVVLETDFDTMRSYDMEPGDIITVTVGQTQVDMPVGTAFTDVDSGECVCRFDTEDNQVALAINMGSFATRTEMAVKVDTAEDPGYKWDILISEISLVLKEKKGYLDEYNARNLTRTDNREDYGEFSDEQFANFRAVSCTGIRENYLFRSSTPVEPAIGRNTYAMAATEAAGIRTVLNLDDTFEVMSGYETFPGSYYSKCNILNCAMTYDFASEEFASGVRVCVQFILSEDGPYLIHCKEGKDRTGILCALLECYMGASLEEIQTDYMLTYENYYHITPEDNVYSIVLKNNLTKTLCGLFGAEDLSAVNLQQAATDYLLSAGLTGDELNQLSLQLGH